MSRLMALSIVTGVLCGIWVQICVSTPLGLLGWAGFAGCTTYFASGKHGTEGFFTAIRQNLFGVLCASIIIWSSGILTFTGAVGFFSGLLTFVMCIGGKSKYLAFIPGTFVGGFSTFAANGDYKGLIISLLLGAALGVACDLGGGLFFDKFGKAETKE
jgi:hypothetical protein